MKLLVRISIEEKYNVISHALGSLMALLGLFLLLLNNADKTAFAAFSIVLYGITLVFMFSASTLYHSVSKTALKNKLRIADHISIYYLIAGTYTPVALILLLDTTGWLLFTIVWAIAGFGTVLKLFFTGKFEAISLVLYAIMGWLIIFDLDNLRLVVSEKGLFVLFLGGLFYTLGIIFYAVKKIPYNHFVWHLFVLAGAFCHWFFIFKYVI